MIRRSLGGDSFTTLVGTYPHGTDPSIPGLAGMPNPIRNTFRSGNVMSQGGIFRVGNPETARTGVAGATAAITVANNDFTTGLAVLSLGYHKIVSRIDFIPGAGVNDTAAEIATAVNRLPGFSATSDAAVVSIVWEGPLDEVLLDVSHYGTATNFTVSPTDRKFAVGSPRIGPPEIGV